MEIKSYKKKKSKLYEITFSNNTKINLYDDIILKYELLLKKEIDEKTLKEIIKDNSFLESYYLALKYLNVKLRTEKEIRKKLKDYDNKVINYTIERLKKEGYLNDLVYIKAYINDSINLKLMGPNKITYELKKMGFKDNDVNDYLNTFESEVWQSKIRKYITKKIQANHNLSGLLLNQKITKDLYNLGFYKEDIDLIMNEFTFSDNYNIYEKEYQKLKNKLSKKYEGDELEYRLKKALWQKGFRN